MRNPFKRVEADAGRQAHYDPDLPYWAVTDHKVLGTFEEPSSAIARAEAHADMEYPGERIMVMFRGVSIYKTAGRDATAPVPVVES
jgi:hypothetical protein